MAEVGSPDSRVSARPKRRFTWLWVLALLAVLVAAPHVASYLLVRRAEKRVADAIAALPFQLAPTGDLADTPGPAPKPEDNAAPVLSEACRMLDALLAAPAPDESSSTEEHKRASLATEFKRLQVIWGLRGPDAYPEDEADLSPEDLRRKAVLDEFTGELMNKGQATITPEVQEAMNARGTKTPPKIPPRDVARARNFLNRFDAVWPLLDEACRRPAYRRDGQDDPTALINLMLLDCCLAMEERRWDAAYRRVVQAARLERLFDQEPASLGMRMATKRITIGTLPELLALHGPSQATADELTGLLQTDVNRRLRNLVAGLCGQCYHVSARATAGRADAADSGLTNVGASFVRWYLLVDQAVLLESMGRMARATELPRRESLATIAAASDEASNHWKLAGVPLLMTLASLPGMTMMAEEYYQSDLYDRQLAVAVQVAAYKEAHGRCPDAISALPRADRLPHDPYTVTRAGEAGRPFGYRVTDDGFMLWSVGPDGTDDGGKTAEELGVAPGAGGDFVLRVPPAPAP